MKLSAAFSAFIFFAGLPLCVSVSSSCVQAAPIPSLHNARAIPGTELSLQQLENIAFDRHRAVADRWRAVTAAGRTFRQAAEPFLQKAFVRPEWFLRNAALVVAPYGARAWAIKWSKALLNDPALVVRTAAVESLRRLKAKEATNQLWSELYSSQNYHRGDSLWIRRHIVQALSETAGTKDEGKFVRLLTDRDISLHPLAIEALQKLTIHKYRTVAEWQSWWSGHAQ